MNSNGLLAICPAYNEEGRIGPLLKKIKPFVPDICVIDDGSTDNTRAEAINEDVIVISHKKNYGKGRAIRTGMDFFLKKTSYTYVIFIDGDGQHNPEDIPKFMTKFEKNPDFDIVIASRFGTGEWKRNMPFTRKLSNLLSRFGLWILFDKLFIEDPQNGYRAYHRRSVNYLKFDTMGYEAETEILIEAFLMGFSIGTVHIQSIYEQQHNASSKFSVFFDTWKIPGIMLKLFFWRKPWILRNNKRKLYYRLHR
jgi:glycosyltransferase involved in cell wall biosynthesis